MSTQNLIAKAQRTINSPIDKIWNALVNPKRIADYMFGTKVTSDWKEGSAITWKGEMNGKQYEDKGTILAFVPNEKLSYSHFSPLSGLPDQPENYHIVIITLQPANGKTEIILTQDKNNSEAAKEESEKNWGMMLDGLKKLLEK